MSGLLRLLAVHGWLAALVLIIAAGDTYGRWSARLTSPDSLFAPEASQFVLSSACSAGQMIPILSRAARGLLSAARAEPLAPAQSTPRQITDAYRELHQLDEGETLGDLAARYGVSVAAIIWSNGLESGDALVVGQLLRVPRVSGVPHIVAEGETVAGIGGGLGVPVEAIRAFGPDHLQDGREPAAGAEIFVPGATLPLPDALLAQGGEGALSVRAAEPAVVVVEDQTNLRAGPGTGYAQQIQLARGRRVALRARHGDWLKVEIAGSAGWVRADLLSIADGQVGALPETDDFPPLPPRWVWPAWGALTSPFGARWGAFHCTSWWW